MTAKTLRRARSEECCNDLKKQLTRFLDRVRTQRFKNDEIRRNKISQIVHSAVGFDQYEILQTATVRPTCEQLRIMGLKRHHHICMDNIKRSALLTF